jgi:hypothetical protein
MEAEGVKPCTSNLLSVAALPSPAHHNIYADTPGDTPFARTPLRPLVSRATAPLPT